MEEQRDVKVFVSWSGDVSRTVAVALRNWLPLLFDRVKPWASDTDIEAGQRGLTQIEQSLQGTQFGIVVVTAANQGAPWLNFEAGALSKCIEEDAEQRVVPLLVDLSSPAQLTGPLSQFQAETADRAGLLSLVLSIGKVAGIDEAVVSARFQAYWSKFEADLISAQASAAGFDANAVKPHRDTSDVLDEILVHVRAVRSQQDSSTSQQTASPTSPEGLRGFLSKTADDSRLYVLSYEENWGQPTKVAVAPLDSYSQNDVLHFQKRVERYADNHGLGIEVTGVPF